MNQLILVGRLVENPTVEDNKTIIKLAVSRSFKNVDGIYETDIIHCILWNGIAANTAEYLKKGDVIGIKGRLQSNGKEIEVVADRVSFISNSKGSEK